MVYHLLYIYKETKAKESGKNITYEEFMRMSYEKLDNAYGKMFNKKVTKAEMLKSIKE